MTGSIATAAGHFTAEVAGPPAGPLVVLLRGFPQTRHSWRQQVPALGAAGYRAIAPDQRGYSPGVRPDPAADLSAYGVDRLVTDVLDLAEAAGRPAPARFHLWGDADHSVGASAARWTADFVTGPFRFEIVPGVGHFITDEAPDIVTAHVLGHIAAHP